MRADTQNLLALLPIRARSFHGQYRGGHGHERLPIGPGSHSEVELRAIDLGWRGRADLITLYDNEIEIVDYKTGEPSGAHAEQLRLYALLWHLDAELNPRGRPATRLLLIYREGAVVVPAPTLDDLRELENASRFRAEWVLSAVRNVPPPAQPSAAVCRRCSVRQLCDAYWTAETQRLLVSPESPDVTEDVALRIQRRHGPASWEAIVESGRALQRGQPILLRGRLQDAMLETLLDPPQLVYVLDAHVGPASSDDSFPVVTVGAMSEVFVTP